MLIVCLLGWYWHLQVRWHCGWLGLHRETHSWTISILSARKGKHHCSIFFFFSIMVSPDINTYATVVLCMYCRPMLENVFFTGRYYYFYYKQIRKINKFGLKDSEQTFFNCLLNTSITVLISLFFVYFSAFSIQITFALCWRYQNKWHR